MTEKANVLIIGKNGYLGQQLFSSEILSKRFNLTKISLQTKIDFQEIDQIRSFDF